MLSELLINSDSYQCPSLKFTGTHLSPLSHPAYPTPRRPRRSPALTVYWSSSARVWLCSCSGWNGSGYTNSSEVCVRELCYHPGGCSACSLQLCGAQNNSAVLPDEVHWVHLISLAKTRLVLRHFKLIKLGHVTWLCLQVEMKP